MSRTKKTAASKDTIKEGLDEILRQSSKLMARRGYHGTSLRFLAKATGRSLAGLYHYFKGKEDLLYLINFHGFNTLLEGLKLILEKTTDEEARLYAFIANHMGYFAQHRDEMRVMTWGTQTIDPQRRSVIRGLKDEYNELGQKIIAALLKKKLGMVQPREKIEISTYLLFGSMNWTFMWYSSGKFGEISKVIDEIYILFLNGIYRQPTKETKETKGTPRPKAHVHKNRRM